jgi:intracellular multiplication protein IcmQ
MKEKLTEQQTNDILEALNDAISNGPWDDSNFLRAIGKNLREIRDNFSNQLTTVRGIEKAKIESHLPNRVTLGVGQQEVFIALYSSEGHRLQSWERILANLPRHTVSRPIYSEEEAVKCFIKSKPNKINEAYVAVYINQSGILTVDSDKVPLDKFGKPLMSLKNGSLSLENITRFVHMSGVYHYIKGRLVQDGHTA